MRSETISINMKGFLNKFMMFSETEKTFQKVYFVKGNKTVSEVTRTVRVQLWVIDPKHEVFLSSNPEDVVEEFILCVDNARAIVSRYRIVDRYDTPENEEAFSKIINTLEFRSVSEETVEHRDNTLLDVHYKWTKARATHSLKNRAINKKYESKHKASELESKYISMIREKDKFLDSIDHTKTKEYAK